MAALKMFCVLPRRKDMSMLAFQDHWRHPHVTHGGSISTVRNLVQSHRVDHDWLAEDQRSYDGVVEAWFESVQDARDLPNHPTYRKYLVPDEPAFIDMTGIRFTFMDETVVISAPHPSDPVSGRDEAHRDGDLAWREWQRPVTTKLIQLFRPGARIGFGTADQAAMGRAIGALRQVWSVPNKDLHPDTATFVAAREFWWPTVTLFEKGIAADVSAREKLQIGAPDVISMLFRAERIK
jgi:hypothetical protein